MKRAALVISTLSLSAFTVFACGGATDSELFGQPTATSQNGTDPTTPAATDPGTSSGTPSTSSSSGGSTSSTSSTSSSSSGGSTSSSSSGGSTSSSSSSSSSSGGSTSSSSGGTWKSPGTYCGAPNGTDVYCQALTSVCCIDQNDGNFTQTCQAGTTCGGGAVTLRCNDRTDCPNGQVCCGTLSQNGYTGTKCQTSCQTGSGGGGQQSFQVEFCDPDAPTDQCPNGQTCQPSQRLPGYSVCR